MRQFIKLILLFSLILLTVSVIIVEVPEYFVNKNADFKLNGSPKYLVVGHSHSQCAINDSLIEDLTNISGSGEAYFYTYLKLKKVVAQNPSIDVVFVEYTNNQISGIMNDWMWSDKHLNYEYPRFSAFMSSKEKYMLASNNFNGFLRANSFSTKENWSRLLKNNYDFLNESDKRKSLGGGAKLDSLIEAAKTSKITWTERKVSATNLRYLKKIIELCKREGKQVVLLRSPMNEAYTGYFNEKRYQRIRTTHFPQIPYLDFSRFPLEQSAFYDLEHLNYKGAQVFTIWFAEQLKKDLNPSSIQNEIAGKRKALSK